MSVRASSDTSTDWMATRSLADVDEESESGMMSLMHLELPRSNILMDPFWSPSEGGSA